MTNIYGYVRVSTREQNEDTVPALWAAARPYQGLVLGKGRLHPAVQATGTGRVPVAAL